MVRGEDLGLCMEDREVLGLWVVDDMWLLVLISKQQETRPIKDLVLRGIHIEVVGLHQSV
jgi:hypothetical protein